ncbi:hypothetical protein PMG71_05940 [Roseofilum sp. BLCC_M154]|uniref:Uncharacterized protein n=1 Tax=Roseofilum acuticapitatum BLCC-M154 TaxID=3022444 RepID=A0ABT7APZ7_9CYAN|nr:hypothetical protein [Roseofilum acuticapitatum]MDJ1168961.1 hypothetical protein [Roseofilum acuticapitatum BLCC-M154]
MSASETVMHQMFANLVAEYHPFANYLGYQEGENGFIIIYDGGNGRQAMVVDTHGNIVQDTTLGTTRTLGLLALGAWLLGDR